MTLELRIPAFAKGGRIPHKFTADGADVSPALEWDGAPANTRAYAIIMEDPDAPLGTWVHWVAYDLPARVTSLPEGGANELPGEARTGRNSWETACWRGPAPPPGKPHRYFFRLYALSAPTGLTERASRDDLLMAMRGKITGEAEWMGTFAR